MSSHHFVKLMSRFRSWADLDKSKSPFKRVLKGYLENNFEGDMKLDFKARGTLKLTLKLGL